VVGIHFDAVVATDGLAINEEIAAAVRTHVAERYRLERLLLLGHLPQSSSASRFTAGACGFFDFTQCGERPEL
jgi:hypothetical protein